MTLTEVAEGVDVQDIIEATGCEFQVNLLSPMWQIIRNGGTFCLCVCLSRKWLVLCARLSPNCFTYLHILGANQLHSYCRYNTPFILTLTSLQIQVKVTKHLFICILLYNRWYFVCSTPPKLFHLFPHT